MVRVIAEKDLAVLVVAHGVDQVVSVVVEIKKATGDRLGDHVQAAGGVVGHVEGLSVAVLQLDEPARRVKLVDAVVLARQGVGVVRVLDEFIVLGRQVRRRVLTAGLIKEVGVVGVPVDSDTAAGQNCKAGLVVMTPAVAQRAPVEE